MSDQDPPAPPDEEPPSTPDSDLDGEPTRADTPVSDPTMAMPAATAAIPATEPSTPGEPPDEPPGPDDPESPPPDRRPWVIIGLLIVILLIGFALLMLNDDDEASTSDTTSSTTTSSTTSSTTTSSTTTTTAPTTTTTAPLTTIDPARCVTSSPDDPDTTAELVYDAYTVNDRACASNLMTASALEQLFGIPGAGGGWEFMGCEDIEDPDPQTLCSYRFEGGSTSFRMNYSDTDGWTVFEVFQTAD